MRSEDQYTALITAWHATRPKFVSTVAFSVRPYAEMQTLLDLLPAKFDVDTAVGEQLDFTGEKIGFSRRVPFPIRGVFFALDTPNRGFNQAVWDQGYSPSIGIVDLDDDTYRAALRLKIANNYWDGTAPAAENALAAFFGNQGTRVFFVDHARVVQSRQFFALDKAGQGFDQSAWKSDESLLFTPAVTNTLSICFSGIIPSRTRLAILDQYSWFKPSGVTVRVQVTSVNGAPIFGFDVNNDFIGGFDRGAWAVSPGYITTNRL